MAHEPALAVRAAEAGGRAVPADVHRALRPRDGDDPLLQRLRPAAGSRRRRTPASSRSSSRTCSPARRPTIYGDGEPDARLHLRRQRRRRRAARLRRRDGASGEVINVATGGRISLNELFTHAARHHRAATVEPMYAPARAGDVRDSQADIGKAQQLLGYSAGRDVRGRPAPHRGVVPAPRHDPDRPTFDGRVGLAAICCTARWTRAVVSPTAEAERIAAAGAALLPVFAWSRGWR